MVGEEKQKSILTKEPLSQQKAHLKILGKGLPEDVLPGVKNIKVKCSFCYGYIFITENPLQEPLPPHPISGMVNKSGGKVRLTFKMENDQLQIGTKERTEKISMSSIKNIVSEPIEGHEEYHIMV